MQKVYEKIIESHRLLKEAERDLIPQGMLICIHDHYDQPRISAHPSGRSNPRDHLLMEISRDGLLTVIESESEQFTGNRADAIMQTKYAIESMV